MDSPSVKVLSRAQSPNGVVDYSAFYAKIAEGTVQSMTPQRTYFLVGNRAPRTTLNVLARFFLSEGLLPARTPEELSGVGEPRGWQFLGETFIDEVSEYRPGVAALDWTPAEGAADTVYLLLVVDEPSDPLPSGFRD